MAKTYEPIATTTLASDTASISFSSIPGTYTDLKLVMIVRSTVVATNADLRLTFNGSTAANYYRTVIQGTGTGNPTSARQTTVANIVLGRPVAASATAGIFSMINVDIAKYSSATLEKPLLSRMASDRNGSGEVSIVAGLWLNTSAVTSLTLTPQSNNFAAGTKATLYGIKEA